MKNIWLVDLLSAYGCLVQWYLIDVRWVACWNFIIYAVRVCGFLFWRGGKGIGLAYGWSWMCGCDVDREETVAGGVGCGGGFADQL